ncbi:arylsulfatase [Stieleria marina]|uniref:Arylsulfatase n=1 Tax=Stieleria marina TaxID=1930275 RepID=A0A517NW47_9BACT|nr:Arylsulfatase [Planctomycetes bacterium K23_9]
MIRLLFVALFSLSCASSQHAANADRPNVILILADDMGLGDLASANGGQSRTPNLDRLATESVRMQNAYSASCVCAPARAALLTGRYPHRTGVVTLNMNKYPKLTRIKQDEVTLADAMRANGYRTGLVGKWHCGTGDGFLPNDRGFDEFEGFTGSQELSYFRYPLAQNGVTQQVTGDYLTDDLSRRAIQFVQRHHDRPFFLHLAHYAPHRPLEAPADLVKSYTDAGLNESTATIYAMIEIMDRGIGELLDELDRLQLADNTIVVFASDNGPDPVTGERFNADHRGMKYQIYEGGIRVPMFVRWPQRLSPGERASMVQFVDVMPTVLDLCGIAHQSKLPIDGHSFRSVLQDKTAEFESVRFWQWNRGRPNFTHNAAMRDGRWKLVRPYVNRKSNPKDSSLPAVLYDLSSDPGETKDVSADNAERFTQMLQQIQQWSDAVEKDRLR